MQTKIKSVLQYPMVVYERVEHDISLGRLGGPSRFRPISNLRSSPIGLVTKKTSGWSLLTHLSYPPGNSVNDCIEEKLTTVQYSKLYNVTYIIQTLGAHIIIGNIHIKSAFRRFTGYPGDFDLLGFEIRDMYYIDKCMPMGCSISCSPFEYFSTFLQWLFRKYMA